MEGGGSEVCLPQFLVGNWEAMIARLLLLYIKSKGWNKQSFFLRDLGGKGYIEGGVTHEIAAEVVSTFYFLRTEVNCLNLPRDRRPTWRGVLGLISAKGQGYLGLRNPCLLFPLLTSHTDKGEDRQENKFRQYGSIAIDTRRQKTGKHRSVFGEGPGGEIR